MGQQALLTSSEDAKFSDALRGVLLETTRELYPILATVASLDGTSKKTFEYFLDSTGCLWEVNATRASLLWDGEVVPDAVVQLDRAVEGWRKREVYWFIDGFGLFEMIYREEWNCQLLNLVEGQEILLVVVIDSNDYWQGNYPFGH